MYVFSSQEGLDQSVNLLGEKKKNHNKTEGYQREKNGKM